MRRLVVASLMVAVGAGAGHAYDAGVIGHKLIVLDNYTAAGRAKVVIISKDSNTDAIHNANGSQNPSDLSGEIRICDRADPSNVGVYDLAVWKANRDNVEKYVHPAAAPGGPGAKVVTIKGGRVLKVVTKSLGDGDAASSDGGATDLVVNDPPGTCTLTVGDDLNLEVIVHDAASSETHCMAMHFAVDSAKAIGGSTGCKIVSATSSSSGGACGLCGGASPVGAFLEAAPPLR